MTNAIIVVILVISLLLLIRSRKKKPCGGECSACSARECPLSGGDKDAKQHSADHKH